MPFSLPSRLWHWMVRFRHRCGYGIHSPFAFGFVRDVVYERGIFYAYAPLAAQHPTLSTPLRMKDLRLLLRLANFQRPTVCLLSGLEPESAEGAWLKAGSCHTRYVGPDESWPPSFEMLYAFDMLYAQGDWTDKAAPWLARLAQGGMLVLHDIASTAARRAAWAHLLTLPQCVVAFDLRDFGVICYRPELQRQHYVVNYF